MESCCHMWAGVDQSAFLNLDIVQNPLRGFVRYEGFFFYFDRSNVENLALISWKLIRCPLSFCCTVFKSMNHFFLPCYKYKHLSWKESYTSAFSKTSRSIVINHSYTLNFIYYDLFSIHIRYFSHNSFLY